MSVVEVWTPGGTARIHGQGYEPTATVETDPEMSEDALPRIALVAARCSTGHADLRDGVWTAVGDPMDAAIDALTRRVGVDVSADRAAAPEVHDSRSIRRRRVSSAGARRVYVKGAADSVLPLCHDEPGADVAMEALAARGLRVIAVATRPAASTRPRDAGDAERDLELLGFIGLLDPPRR